MGFQVSPGVNITERDLTLIVPAVATTAAGFAGAFQWGPVGERILVDGVNTLRRIFQEPNGERSIYTSFFTCANFLGYGNNLQVVRVVDENAKNATTDGTAALVKNRRLFDESFTVPNGNSSLGGDFIGKYPGDLGNSLKVYVVDGNAGNTVCYVNSALSANGNQVKLSSLTGTDATPDTLTITSGDTLKFLTNGQEHRVIGYVDSSGGEVRDFFSVTANLGLSSGGGNTATALIVQPPLRQAYVAVQGGSADAKVEVRNVYAEEFTTLPSTTEFIDSRGGSNDALNILLVDEDGRWTGNKGAILEKFENVSKSSDARTFNGGKNFYKDVINDTSPYIYANTNLTGVTPDAGLTATYGEINESGDVVGFGRGFYGQSLNDGIVSLAGVSGSQLYTDGYQLFEDPETVDVSLILGGDADATLGGLLVDLADARKDCVVFLSPPVKDVENKTPETAVKNIVDFRKNNLNKSSSYAVLDGNTKFQLDPYNDVVRALPFNGDVAGLVARTEVLAEPWFSPAGFNRGQLRGVVRLAFNPTKTHRDELYKNNINPVVSFPGQGTVLFGDKTLQTKPSAFDRINVRRLFIILEKAIATAAKFQLFELNDSFTRNQFKNLIIPFLRTVQSRRGIIDFKVVCDESNNTGEVIDRNEFVADIFIKPARSINFIQLNFIATRTGVDFNEVGG